MYMFYVASECQQTGNYCTSASSIYEIEVLAQAATNKLLDFVEYSKSIEPL